MTIDANRKFKPFTCAICGVEFQAERKTAKYCTPKCRQVAKRDRDMLWQRFDDINRMLDEIARTDHPDRSPALKRIANRLTNFIA